MNHFDNLPKHTGADAKEIQKKYSRGFRELQETAEVLKYSTREAIKLLPSISALAATLLVIATFNSNLIPLTNSVKILLTALLMVILLGVWLMYWDLLISQGQAYKTIESIGKRFFGIDVNPIIKETKKISLFSVLHLVTMTLFALSVILIALLIWKIDPIGLVLNFKFCK